MGNNLPVETAGSMRRFDPIPELGRFLALLGLAGVAISQPVLAAFGDSPETFIFRNAYGGDVVLFALAVSIVPALLLWSAGVAIGFVWPSARGDVHGATAGLLVGLAVAQLLSSFASPVAFGVAALVGVGTWMLIRRFAGARLWSQLLVLLPAYSLMVFLVASPASDAFGSESFEAAKAGPSTTPIVLIVLDELPTASLITPDGQMDSTRFPNLAGLAAESTWYRNATTVAGFTDQAVPAILTGRYPRRAAPFYANFPDNFFRLVAASHDLVASETITRLCPRSACGDHPTPPGRSTEPAQGGADLRGLFSDAFSVWRDGLTGRAHEQIRTEQFQEDVDAASPAPHDAENPFPPSAQPVAQPARLDAFLTALRPADRPMAAMLHLVLPHSPWRYLPDGRSYAEPAEESGLPGVYTDAWTASVARHTHLLQTGYADRLVGQVLDRLRAVGLYDDAVVAVVADHGVSFMPDHWRRGYTPETASEIMWVPMLVKAPHQTRTVLDESNVETIDLLPTIASLADLDIPWPVDGVPAGSPEIAARGNRKTFFRFNYNLVQPEEDKRLEIDGEAPYRQMLDGGVPPLDESDDLTAGLYVDPDLPDLVGREFVPSDREPGAIQIDDRDRMASGGQLVLTFSGSLEEGVAASHVVAAADGRVVALSPVVTRRDGTRGFEIMLPATDTPRFADLRFGLVRQGQGDSTMIETTDS